MNTEQITFERLPKYLMVDRGRTTWYFHPVIFKWEWEYHQNAYFAMYAKFNPRSNTFNVSKALFWASAGTYEEAKEKFLQKYCKLDCIKGKMWYGKDPVKLDLMMPGEIRN